MIEKLIVFIIGLCFFGCTSSNNINDIQIDENNQIVCTENGCKGTYSGAEFINGSDVAHQFSNEMSARVGDKLKELYADGNYSKVDFSNIIMTTEGMGSGNVIYKLFIPFKSVKEKCQAYTSFDHVGGWNHTPELSARKAQLHSVLLEGELLDVSKLISTPEGLQEYWIQWKNEEIQSDCKPFNLGTPIDMNIINELEYTSGGVPKKISNTFCNNINVGFYGRYNIVDMTLNVVSSNPITSTIDIYKIGTMENWKPEDINQKVLRIWTKSNQLLIWGKLKTGDKKSILDDFLNEHKLFHYVKGTSYYFETTNYKAQFRIENETIKEITLNRKCLNK